MNCGDTFLMPAPGGMATPHLWIVVTQPDVETHLCAIVSVTTLRNSKDQTVILRPGDHPFIRHESTIFYGDAMIVDVRRLQAEISAGLAVARGEVPGRDAAARTGRGRCVALHQAEVLTLSAGNNGGDSACRKHSFCLANRRPGAGGRNLRLSSRPGSCWIPQRSYCFPIKGMILSYWKAAGVA